MGNFKYLFGQKIKSLRKEHKFTQEKLSEKIGINLRQLARIEAGESFATAETIELLCEALNIQPYELFNFDLSETSLKTGTGDIVHYKAIRSGNVIQLVSNNIEKEKSFEIQSPLDTDECMIKMSKDLRREITVDEFKEGVLVKTRLYRPDGTFEITNHIEDNNNFDKLTEKITTIKGDSKKIDFLNLALDALTNKSALNDLKLLIKGIELTL